MMVKDKDNESEAKQENTADRPKTPFSYDDLKMAWRKTAFRFKENGLDTLFTAMTTRDPNLGADNLIEHFVDNNVQKEFFQKNETDVMTFLRQELNNWSIIIKVDIGSEESGDKKLYSGQDKFKDMAERNPHLKTLQQRFKLDIDF